MPSGSGWQPGGPPTAPPPMSATGTDGFATASLIFGILPMCAGILGIIFGFIAIGRIVERV